MSISQYLEYHPNRETSIFDAEEMERGLMLILMHGSPREADMAAKLLTPVKEHLRTALRPPSADLPAWKSPVYRTENGQSKRRLPGTELENDHLPCPNALTPDGPVCPRCQGKRAPSGVDGRSWVHI